jgi:hypothetical protein
MSIVNFNTDLNDQFKGFDPLPAGEYRVQITDAENKMCLNLGTGRWSN